MIGEDGKHCHFLNCLELICSANKNQTHLQVENSSPDSNHMMDFDLYLNYLIDEQTYTVTPTITIRTKFYLNKRWVVLCSEWLPDNDYRYSPVRYIQSFTWTERIPGGKFFVPLPKNTKNSRISSSPTATFCCLSSIPMTGSAVNISFSAIFHWTFRYTHSDNENKWRWIFLSVWPWYYIFRAQENPRQQTISR